MTELSSHLCSGHRLYIGYIQSMVLRKVNLLQIKTKICSFLNVELLVIYFAL